MNLNLLFHLLLLSTTPINPRNFYSRNYNPYGKSYEELHNFNIDTYSSRTFRYDIGGDTLLSNKNLFLTNGSRTEQNFGFLVSEARLTTSKETKIRLSLKLDESNEISNNSFFAVTLVSDTSLQHP